MACRHIALSYLGTEAFQCNHNDKATPLERSHQVLDIDSRLQKWSVPLSFMVRTCWLLKLYRRQELPMDMSWPPPRNGPTLTSG